MPNSKNELHIQNSKKRECPTCRSVYGMYNSDEIILRKISFVYINEKTGETIVKCKRCKSMVHVGELKNV